MKILGIDSTARAASVAIVQDDRILCESYVDVALTHSQTLLPMVQASFSAAAMSLHEMDYLAVAAGPGSFTGLRIGIAAVKGMAFPKNLPCIPVSTLEGIACNLTGWDCIACAVMDARCKQVYTACFDMTGEIWARKTPDEALALETLRQKLLTLEGEKPIVLVGDGAELCYNYLSGNLRIRLAPPQLRYQHANSVCRAAARHLQEAVPSGKLVPAYLRLPQAERERLQKEGTV